MKLAIEDIIAGLVPRDPGTFESMLESAGMNPLTLLALRRLALLAFLLTALLVLVFRILPAYGLMGPSLAEEIESASRAVEAARRYGASEDLAPYQAATQALARARELSGGGHSLEGHRAAQTARRQAVEAQRLALSRAESRRREAERITLEIDRRLSELEALYSEVVPGLAKDEVSRLLSSMKTARRAGAGLYLAYESRDFVRVLSEEKAAIEVLDSTREALRSARALPHAGRQKGPGAAAESKRN